MKFLIAALLPVLAVSAPQMTLAAGGVTGNEVLESCRKFATEKTATSPKEAYFMGVCSGMMGALIEVGLLLDGMRRFCLPVGVTDRQSTKVFISFLDAHPQRLHEQATSLAVEAFHAAWPCKP